MYGYVEAVYKYFQDWYHYLFCKDIQPYEARELIDADLHSLNRIIHYCKAERKKEVKNS